MPSTRLALLYHRVAVLQSDPWQLAVTPRHFEEHLEVLARLAEVLPLGDLLTKPSSPGSRMRVALTLDDGYRDSVAVALPLLERFDLPATLMLVSGELHRNREFFWDEIERLSFDEATVVHDVAELCAAEGIAITLEDSAASFDSAAEFPSWTAYSDRLPGLRHELCRELVLGMRDLAPSARDWLLEQLRRAVGISAVPRTEYRSLTVAELAPFLHSKLIEVGSHSVSHSNLVRRPPAEVEAEVCGSRAALREVVGREIAIFSYPYGDWTPAIAETVQQAGYSFGCAAYGNASSTPGVPSAFAIPRIAVGDVCGDSFERFLRDHASKVMQ